MAKHLTYRTSVAAVARSQAVMCWASNHKLWSFDKTSIRIDDQRCCWDRFKLIRDLPELNLICDVVLRLFDYNMGELCKLHCIDMLIKKLHQ